MGAFLIRAKSDRPQRRAACAKAGIRFLEAQTGFNTGQAGDIKTNFINSV
jgi:hypothetical protein